MVAGEVDREQLRGYGERLWEILDDYEAWPGRRLVGDDGSRAAWLVAQFVIDGNGALVPWPIDDRALVDARRRRLGLSTFAEHTTEMLAEWRARTQPGN